MHVFLTTHHVLSPVPPLFSPFESLAEYPQDETLFVVLSLSQTCEADQPATALAIRPLKGSGSHIETVKVKTFSGLNRLVNTYRSV
jgi:hypothetical protein